jgi:NADH-quinone oxidoreductase subunit H
MENFVNQTVLPWLAGSESLRGLARFPALIHAVSLLGLAFVVATFAAVVAGMTSWWERKVAGRMQSRIGPNRNGPHGFLQWIADAAKLLFKEDLIPAESDRKMFRLAPYFVLMGFILTFVALPFGQGLVAADLDVGIFFIVSITALVVVGILMSGWASNSKWGLFGGMRSAAQVVSYEIPAGLSLLVPVLMAGSLSTQEIIAAQGGPELGPWYMRGGWPWNWFLFANPWAMAAFFVFLTAALAEGNRTPFDLPEAESELVAGYFTEYSGIRFAVYFLTEWGNVYVMSALCTVLFLGGWQIPGVGPDTFAQATGWAWLGWQLLSLLVFLSKTLVMMNVVIWLRWTLPRIRVDQMMSVCWKYLVPLSLVLVVLVAGGEVLAAVLEVDPVVLFGWHVLFFAVAGLVPLVLFLKRTFLNIRLMGDAVDLSNW